MDMDSTISADSKEQLQVEETDDSCKLEFFEIVPLTRDIDGSCTTECVSGDWSAEVKQENLVVKQEPDDNSEFSAMYSVKNDAVPAEVDETQNHIKPALIPETHHCTCCSTTECVSGDWSSGVKEENLSFVKKEPDDNYESSVMSSVKCDAVPADVDATDSHMQPVVVLEALDFSHLQMKYHIRINTGESLCEVKTEADSDDHTEHPRDGKPRPYLCTVCDKRFIWKKHLTTHSRIHTGENCYTCSQCGKRFSSQSGLFHHVNIHRGKFKCTECGKCCQSSHRLAEHRRTHSGEKPFQCSVCSKRFTASNKLVNHSRTHSGDKPYKCHVCDKTFGQHGYLQSHMRVHTGEKPYKCRMCDQAFNRSGNLSIHMRVHTGEKPYKCSLCNRSFSQSCNLQQHKRCMHSNTTDENV